MRSQPIVPSTNSTQSPLIIGALLPLTGASSSFGEELRNAIDLAVQDVNSQGGINGRLLKIIYEDDQCDPKTGVTAITKLIEVDAVKIVLGSWCSGVVVAEGPVAESHKVIVMAEGISPKISTLGDYIFRIQPSASFYMKDASAYVRSLGISRAGIIFGNHEFGVSVKDSFTKEFTSAGGRVVESQPYDQGAADLRTQLTKIASVKPDLLFVIGYQPDNINIIKQLHDLGITARVMATPTIETKATLDALGNLSEEIIYPYHFDEKANPSSSEFVKRFTETFGKPPSGFAPLMYDGTRIISEALQVCANRKQNQESDTNCIKETLYKIKYNGIVGTVTFDSNGDPSVPIYIREIKGGAFGRVKH